MVGKKGQVDEGARDIRPDLSHLTYVERVLCAGLIYRQWTHDPRRVREIQKYGPDGFVQLCSARALQVFVLAACVVGVPLGIVGEDTGAVLCFALVSLVVVAGMLRCISAGRAGRQWRSSSTNGVSPR